MKAKAASLFGHHSATGLTGFFLTSLLGQKQWCHCFVSVVKQGQLVLSTQKALQLQRWSGWDWWTVGPLTSEHTLFIGFGEPPWSPWSGSRCFDQVWVKRSWARSFRRNWWHSWDGTSLNTHRFSQGAFISDPNFKKQKKQPNFDAQIFTTHSAHLVIMLN